MENKLIQGEKATDKLETKVTRELIKAYAKSLKAIRAQLAEVFAKYAVDDELTFAEIQKYNRLANLEKSIMAELVALTGKNAKALKQTLAEIYNTSYYFTAYAIETEAGAKLGFGLLNPKVAEEAIQVPISGLTLNETLEKNRKNILVLLRQQITQALIQGESYKKMADRVKGALESDTAKSLLVVQTEAHRATQTARVSAFDKAETMGVEIERYWTSSLDRRTRDAHRTIDGQKADKEGYFHYRGMKTRYPGGWGNASMDIRCR